MKFSQFKSNKKKSKSFTQFPNSVIVSNNLNNNATNSTSKLGKSILSKMVLGKGE